MGRLLTLFGRVQHAYFDRDNVGLPGLANYFQEESQEERHHAELLMKFQVPLPPSDQESG